MPPAKLASRSLRLRHGERKQVKGSESNPVVLTTNGNEHETVRKLASATTVASGKPAIVSRSPHQMSHELVRVTVTTLDAKARDVGKTAGHRRAGSFGS